MIESQYTSRINKGLPPSIYALKLSLRFQNGVPDTWYSGPNGDLWIEYKYLQKMPSRVPLIPKLSELQKKWLNERYDQGRNVAVIVGSPAGAMILTDKKWNLKTNVDNLKTQKQVVNWIIGAIG